MTSPHKTELEVALERLSSETWERLRAIKAFSRRPVPFNSVRLGETTITDLAMMELCRLGLARSIFIQTPPHKEARRGTDFEWWVGSANTGWFRLAVQAKKLDMKKEQYLGLGQKVNGKLQIDVLERYAERNRVTPLYCFYNYSIRAGDPKYWHCCQGSVEPDQLGCTLTPASRVQQAINTRGKRTFEFIHEYDNTLPWRCMAACPQLQFPNAQGIGALSSQAFPLTDYESFYRELPFDFLAPVGVMRTADDPLFTVTAAVVADDDNYYDEDYDCDTVVIEFAGMLADYYDLEVGLPKAIYVTELPPR